MLKRIAILFLVFLSVSSTAYTAAPKEKVVTEFELTLSEESKKELAQSGVKAADIETGSVVQSCYDGGQSRAVCNVTVTLHDDEIKIVNLDFDFYEIQDGSFLYNDSDVMEQYLNDPKSTTYDQIEGFVDAPGTFRTEVNGYVTGTEEGRYNIYGQISKAFYVSDGIVTIRKEELEEEVEE